jgi:glutamine amidotransferase-like uncharacterized protein
VYADAGAWHIGTRSVVEALESAGVPCRLLDHSLLTPRDLQGLKVIIVPGGYAYYEEMGAGRAGTDAIREFVRNGGTYLGICAGAYLASAEVLWENERYIYNLRLFNGSAEDSISGVPDWPRTGSVKLAVAEEGKLFGLAPFAGRPIYYQGGCCFRHCGDAAVLARYPDKSPAVIARKFGSGRVILTGVHFERPASSQNLWAAPPEDAGELLLALVGLKMHPPAREPGRLYSKDLSPPSDSVMNKDQLLALERRLRAELMSERGEIQGIR